MKTTLALIIFVIPFIIDTNSTNPNDQYIKDQLADIDPILKKCKFKPGKIYTSRDTVETQIIEFKGRFKKNSFLFCIARTDNDSLVSYSARDIRAYEVDSKLYLKKQHKDNHFFVEQLSEGKIQLYIRNGIPSDKTIQYYFTKDNKDWHRFNPFVDSGKITEGPASGMASADGSFVGRPAITYTDFNTDESFAAFFTDYTSDCPLVVNGIKSGFFEMRDIETVVRTYNSCK